MSSTGIPINEQDLIRAKEKAFALGIVVSAQDLFPVKYGLDMEIIFSPVHPKAGELSAYLWRLQIPFTKNSKC